MNLHLFRCPMQKIYLRITLIIIVLAVLWPVDISSAQSPTPIPPTITTTSTVTATNTTPPVVVNGTPTVPPANNATPTSPANGPTYIVQAGDSLWLIAQRFGVSLEALESINGITNPSQLQGGMALIIPGLEGIQGKLVTLAVGYGETLDSISDQYGISTDMLKKLNHLTSPSELYVGYSLVLPESNSITPVLGHTYLAPGQSLLELSVLNNTNPWSIARVNSFGQTTSAIPGKALFLPGKIAQGPSALPEDISKIQLKPSTSLQGKATVIRVTASAGTNLGGTFVDHPLHFFQDKDGTYVAIQGVHAMTDPGLYPMLLSETLKNGNVFTFSQMVNVGSVDYPYDNPLTVDPSTIDPAVTKPEDTEWAALTAPLTAQKLWDGKFKMVTPLSLEYCLSTGDCWASRFGNRRSYNGSTYNLFHTGLDIVGADGTDIYAAAAGVVVFSGPLTVRGNATMIDHGWGVYSAYLHQSEMLVKVGDHVEAGQLIGRIGSTGRVEGPHLHFEIWAGGVQVDPVDWLSQEYP